MSIQQRYYGFTAFIEANLTSMVVPLTTTLPAWGVCSINLSAPPDINSGQKKYQYPEKIKEYGNSGGEFPSGNRYLQIGMKQYSNSNQYAIFKQIGVGFIMIYWVLFGIWATVKAYHLRRSNVGWVAIFFVLNLAGYLLNIIYYRFKLDSVG